MLPEDKGTMLHYLNCMKTFLATQGAEELKKKLTSFGLVNKHHIMNLACRIKPPIGIVCE